MSIIRYTKDSTIRYAYLNIFPDQFKTEKEKMDDTGSVYYRRSKDSGVFKDGDLTVLKQNKYRQIWRNHLLGESILFVDKPKYSHFHSLTFYPEGNTHFSDVLPKYLEYLKPEYLDRVQGVTYEKYFEICRKHLPDDDYKKWLEYLERRYIVI